MRPNRSLHWLPVLGVVAVVAAAPAQAEPASDPAAPSPISGAVEEFGQSLCPMLVEPGTSLAAAVSEMQGNTGFVPTLTGMIAGVAIKTQCPAFMTRVANGDLSSLKLPGARPDAAGEMILPGLLGVPAGISRSSVPQR